MSKEGIVNEKARLSCARGAVPSSVSHQLSSIHPGRPSVALFASLWYVLIGVTKDGGNGGRGKDAPSTFFAFWGAVLAVFGRRRESLRIFKAWPLAVGLFRRQPESVPL